MAVVGVTVGECSVQPTQKSELLKHIAVNLCTACWSDNKKPILYHNLELYSTFLTSAANPSPNHDPTASQQNDKYIKQ